MERVLVIGATSGIGRALAGRLAASGCRVGIVGGRAEPLTERDSDPSENPFFQAAADVTVDTSDLNIEEVCEAVLQQVNH